MKRAGPQRSRQIGSLRATVSSERGTRSLASDVMCYCICTLHGGHNWWVLIGLINRRICSEVMDGWKETGHTDGRMAFQQSTGSRPTRRTSGNDTYRARYGRTRPRPRLESERTMFQASRVPRYYIDVGQLDNFLFEVLD